MVEKVSWHPPDAPLRLASHFERTLRRRRKIGFCPPTARWLRVAMLGLSARPSAAPLSSHGKVPRLGERVQEPTTTACGPKPPFVQALSCKRGCHNSLARGLFDQDEVVCQAVVWTWRQPWRQCLLGSLRGDLCVQFVEDYLAERAEILRYHHEGSGAADHVVAVIGIKATRRIGVRGIPRPLFGQDDETVDGDPFGKRLVTRVDDGAADILGAVTRYVDSVAVGVERCTVELRHGKIDAAADRGSVAEGARCLDDLGGKIPGGGLVANDGPVDDDLLLTGARPFHEADRDLA